MLWLFLWMTYRIPIYVISLEHRTDRRALISQNIALDWRYYIAKIDAVNGKKHLEHFISHPGEVGCFLSHIQMWKTFLHTWNSYALILEDDANIVLPRDWKLVSRAVNNAPADWDIIWIGAKKLFEPWKNEKINAYIDINRTKLWGTHAYLISKRGARKLYNKYAHYQAQKNMAFFRNIEPIDDAMSQSPDIKQYILSNDLIKQIDSASDTY